MFILNHEYNRTNRYFEVKDWSFYNLNKYKYVNYFIRIATTSKVRSFDHFEICGRLTTKIVKFISNSGI